jgi:ketosteroid isomerase-like protein
MALVVMALLLPFLATQAGEPPAAAAIRALLTRQEADWNRGEIAAFMSGYARVPTLVFTSGGQIWRGYEDALARYRLNYPDRETMGRLTFADLEITLLGDSAAVVLGEWSLRRAKDAPHGVFTLVLRKEADGWKIIHDHTSAAPRRP